MLAGVDQGFATPNTKKIIFHREKGDKGPKNTQKA